MQASRLILLWSNLQLFRNEILHNVKTLGVMIWMLPRLYNGCTQGWYLELRVVKLFIIFSYMVMFYNV